MLKIVNELKLLDLNSQSKEVIVLTYIGVCQALSNFNEITNNTVSYRTVWGNQTEI